MGNDVVVAVVVVIADLTLRCVCHATSHAFIQMSTLCEQVNERYNIIVIRRKTINAQRNKSKDIESSAKYTESQKLEMIRVNNVRR